MDKREKIAESLLFVAWTVATVATAGSLFFSEVMGFIPCDLCWYQRILMYPLVLMLGIAVVRKDYSQSLYGLCFALIGMGVSSYHYMLQKIPALASVGNACGIVPCNAQYINWFGFITIPFLALVGFILVAVLSWYSWRLTRKEIRG